MLCIISSMKSYGVDTGLTYTLLSSLVLLWSVVTNRISVLVLIVKSFWTVNLDGTYRKQLNQASKSDGLV